MAAPEPQPSADRAPAEKEASADALQPVDDPARSDASNGGFNGATDGDGMSWNFSRTARGPRIAYGVPQTDNVRLMLRCPERSRALLSFIRPDEFAEGKPDMLAIASGNSRRSLTIETEQGPLGTSVEAEAPLSAGPLQQFRSGSELEVRWGDETIRVPGSAQGPVRQFFEACS